MSRKTTTLAREKSEQLTKLLSIHKTNPYHARVMFMAEEDQSYNYCENLLKKIESFDENGKLIKFSLSCDKKEYKIDDDSVLSHNTICDTEYIFNLQTNKFTYRDSYDSLVYNHYNLMPSDLYRCLSEMNDKFTAPFLKELLNYLPWMSHIFEFNLLRAIPMNDIYENKLFNVKKALKYQYCLSHSTSLKIHKFTNSYHYERADAAKKLHPDNVYNRLFHIFSNEDDGSVKKRRHSGSDVNNEFFRKHHPYLTHTENFNEEHLINGDNVKIFTEASKYAKLLDREVNCSWSLQKMKDKRNLWGKEFLNIKYTYENAEMIMSSVFRMFAEFTGVTLLHDLKSIATEGFIQNHCVGGYQENVESGRMGLYHYKGYTFALLFEDISHRYNGSSNWKRAQGVYVNEFRGFSNCTPPDSIRDEVEQLIISFNRELFSIDFELYEELISEAKDLQKKNRGRNNYLVEVEAGDGGGVGLIDAPMLDMEDVDEDRAIDEPFVQEHDFEVEIADGAAHMVIVEDDDGAEYNVYVDNRGELVGVPIAEVRLDRAVLDRERVNRHNIDAIAKEITHTINELVDNDDIHEIKHEIGLGENVIIHDAVPMYDDELEPEDGDFDLGRELTKASVNDYSIFNPYADLIEYVEESDKVRKLERKVQEYGDAVGGFADDDAVGPNEMGGMIAG